MNAKTEKKVVLPLPAPLRDEELTAVTGAGGEVLHIVVKYGKGKPVIVHEKL